MLRRHVRHTALLLTVMIGLVAGCSSTAASSGDDPIICTAGQYGYCLCRNGQDGTRLCKPDGRSFEACKMQGSEDCPGGEVPLDDAGNPILEDGGVVSGTSTRGCPGRTVTVVAGQPLRINGNTSTSTSVSGGERGGACEMGDNTPEEVYELAPAESGELTVTMTPLAFDGVLYARKGECGGGQQAACGNSSSVAGNAETLRFKVLAGEKVWVFADGAAGAAGSYALDIGLEATSFCGDGRLDPGEACDDGNRAAGDGCGPSCKPDGNPSTAGACPGMSVAIWGPTVTVTGQKTSGYADGARRVTGRACPGGTSTLSGVGAPDRVYAVTAKKTGTLKIATSKADFDHQIYVRSACADQPSEITCASAVTGSGGEAAQLEVKDGVTYSVLVDGATAGGAGAFEISFEIP